MLQQIWRQERLKEEEMIRRQLQFEQQWRHQLELQAANNWKDDFIQNEVLEDRIENLDKVKISFIKKGIRNC